MPVKIGTVEISGLIYNLCVMEGDVPLEDNSNGEIYESGDPLTTIGIQGRIDFQCRGVRLNNTKVDKVGVVYAEDHRLCWRIIDPMPRIMVSWNKCLVDGILDSNYMYNFILFINYEVCSHSR